MNEFLTYNENLEVDPEDVTLPIASMKTSILTITKDKQTYCLVQMRDCLITHVSLKTKNQKDLIAAIPYALEEQLAQSVEELHFTTTEALENGVRPVLVIAHNKLVECIGNTVEDVDVIIPDVLALPIKDAAWTIAMDGNRALVRSGLYDGFECNIEQLGQQLMLHKILEEKPVAVDLCIFGLIDLPEFPEDIRELVKVHRYKIPFKEWLGDQLSVVPGLNLLSGQYAIKNADANNIKLWLPAIILFLIAITYHYGYSFYKVTQLENEITDIDKSSRELFSQTFPETKRIVNPRVQAEQNLKSLSANSSRSHSGFFDLFIETMSTVREFPEMQVLGFNWKQDNLQLQLNAPSVTVVEQLEKSLAEKGYKVEIINAVNKEGRFKAQLKIRSLKQ